MSSDFQNRQAKGLEHVAPETHPTADVLNAYAERLLPNAEEQRVVAHLSACADCRDVVYLASGAVEEESLLQPATAPVRRLSWWTWAVPLVAVLIVGSTVFLLQSNRVNRGPTDSSQEVAQAKRDTPPQLPASATAAPAPANRPSAKAEAPVRTNESTALHQKKEATGAGNATLAMEGRRETQLGSLSADKNAPAESREEVKAKAVAAPPPAPSGAERDTITAAGQNALVETEAVPAQAAPLKDNAAKSIAGYSLAKSNVQRADATAQWRVTGDGKLEHRLLGEWKPALATPNAHFLTVTSVGSDLWAAGKNLALYHSADNGVHWERQTLPAPETDILRIEFSSSTKGVLTTSSAGTFSTQDGGRNWASVDHP